MEVRESSSLKDALKLQSYEEYFQEYAAHIRGVKEVFDLLQTSS